MTDHGYRESAGQAITACAAAKPITEPITTVHGFGKRAGQAITAGDHDRSRTASTRAITASPPFSTGGKREPAALDDRRERSEHQS